MKRAQKIAPVTSLQPPYSMLARAVESEILPFCSANNIGVIVVFAHAQRIALRGMTAERAANFAPDDFRRNVKDFQEPKLSKNLDLVEHLKEIGQRHGRSPGEVAIAWTLHNRPLPPLLWAALRQASRGRYRRRRFPPSPMKSPRFGHL